ncbi:hypothetical protein G6O69_10075 [Pseudenhygromyxa sp. WMMC2535]|uniref:hypothetical protein n=1 Tax=Pseudenhygromyxa sp. WMMC2535 TaxID=2712867 RepID=UPI001556D633|nr:hypothetical protein [Pseudenhygromyxa sp. WMMC2535]NVB38179.1 hypothetical protein [Pseudenhygromyxa sp. WMMC2535]
MSLRLGIVVGDDALLRAARTSDPVDVVVLRSTFLNPPRAAAARRLAERIHELHEDVEIVPYAWHYLSYEADDRIEVGSNRALEAKPGSFGHFRATPEVEQAWNVTKICAEAVGAQRVVVRTPPSFSPGSLSRRRLTRFIETRSEGDPKLVWEPQGLWEPTAAAIFAAPLGVEVLAAAFSMTGQLLECDGASWLQVTGGKDAKLRSSHAEVLAYALADLADEDAPDLTLLFEGPRAYANLRAFSSNLDAM